MRRHTCVFVGTTAKEGEIAAGRSSEQAPIFAAELRGAFVADLMAGGRRVERAGAHEPASFLQAELFSVLQRTHRTYTSPTRANREDERYGGSAVDGSVSVRGPRARTLTALLAADFREVIETLRDVGVIRIQGLLPDSQRALVQPLRFGIALLLAMEFGQVVEAPS